MPHRTSIEWVDYASNPLRARIDGKRGWACAKISPGCSACYSEAINRRFGTGLDFSALNARKVEHYLDEKELRHILKFRPKPPFKNGRQRPSVFPFDMTDVFGDWVPFETIDKCFAAFALRPDVDFLVLTKRPERKAEYLNDDDLEDRLTELWQGDDPDKKTWNLMLPLPNVHLGTSIENQEQADKRIPHLLRCPAAVRFLSVEPLLEPVDLSSWLNSWVCYGQCGGDEHCPGCEPPIGWVIVGSESGHGRRPMNLDWARLIRDQCRKAGVAFFMKQLEAGGKIVHDMDYFPADLRVREFPAVRQEA